MLTRIRKVNFVFTVRVNIRVGRSSSAADAGVIKSGVGTQLRLACILTRSLFLCEPLVNLLSVIVRLYSFVLCSFLSTLIANAGAGPLVFASCYCTTSNFISFNCVRDLILVVFIFVVIGRDSVTFRPLVRKFLRWLAVKLVLSLSLTTVQERALMSRVRN